MVFEQILVEHGQEDDIASARSGKGCHAAEIHRLPGREESCKRFAEIGIDHERHHLIGLHSERIALDSHRRPGLAKERTEINGLDHHRGGGHHLDGIGMLMVRASRKCSQ